MDYSLLKLIWWFVVNFLLIACMITVGMDFGVGMLLPIIGKNDRQRSLLISSIGPTWEGNQVWLITLVAALFAVWPLFYATMFSFLYILIYLVLLALILRPPGFDYRNKITNQLWRNSWDWCLFIGSLLPSIGFGIIVGNLFIGLPFHFDESLHPVFTGRFWQLFNPFAILWSVVFVSLFILHASMFLQIKLTDKLHKLAQICSLYAAVVFALSFCGVILWLKIGITGYKVVDIGKLSWPLSPLTKVVAHGNWLENQQWLLAMPILSVLLSGLTCWLSLRNRPIIGIILSSMIVIIVVCTIGAILFPFTLPSLSVPSHSLTLWDSVSSSKSLIWMLASVIFLLPIVLVYTVWAYRVMRGKVY